MNSTLFFTTVYGKANHQQWNPTHLAGPVEHQLDAGSNVAEFTIFTRPTYICMHLVTCTYPFLFNGLHVIWKRTLSTVPLFFPLMILLLPLNPT
jgi:hypothetical protein